MPRDEEIWCNYGMLRPAPGRLTATCSRAATVAMASHVTHGTEPRPPALHGQQGYCVPWKNIGKCFAKYTIALGIWLACWSVEEKIPRASRTSPQLGCTLDPEESPACSPTHQSSAGIPCTGAARAKSHPGHFEDRDRNKPVHSEGKERTLPACVHCVYLDRKQTTTNS